jgi:adenylylsulfate kinase
MSRIAKIPLLLAPGDESLSSLSPGVELGLYDPNGRLLGILTAPPATGFILWFTGLSGAGKSTLSHAVAAELAGERRIEILDGDEVRTHLSKGLTFSREDRDTNVHRIAFVARLLAHHGVGVITAAISPYRITRDAIRQLATDRGITFLEVFANASLESLVERDPKGLYAKALAGELPHFTGVSDPYEEPLSPDVVVFTDRESVATSVARIVDALRSRGLVAAPSGIEVHEGVEPSANDRAEPN